VGFVDQFKWRYELIRPLVLFADRTAQQRARKTHTRRLQGTGTKSIIDTHSKPKQGRHL
jgi:hypothetical protein